MSRTNKFKNAQIESALRNSNGLLTGAAKELQCSYVTIYNYIKRSVHLQNVLLEISNKVIDVAENHIFVAIQNGDMNTIKWYLKYKGQSRGYLENMNVNVRDFDNFELSAVPNTEDSISKLNEYLKSLV